MTRKDCYLDSHQDALVADYSNLQSPCSFGENGVGFHVVGSGLCLSGGFFGIVCHNLCRDLYLCLDYTNV